MPPIGCSPVIWISRIIMSRCRTRSRPRRWRCDCGEESRSPYWNYGNFITSVDQFSHRRLLHFSGGESDQQDEETSPTAAPVAKDCPACTMSIPIKATRCPHCTSDLGASAPRRIAICERWRDNCGSAVQISIEVRGGLARLLDPPNNPSRSTNKIRFGDKARSDPVHALSIPFLAPTAKTPA